jgi:hypothetical protein
VTLIAVFAVVPVAIYFTIADQGRQIHEEMTIDSLYARADVYVDNAEPEEALVTFLQIIDRDVTQEKAWHEAGKILNRFEMCANSLEHYEQYVERFPESVRGIEGYEIAKRC